MFWVGRVMTPLEPPEIKGSWFQTCWKKHPNSTQGVPKLFEIPWMWDRSSVFNRGHFPWDLFWGGMKLHANFYGNFDLKKFPHHRCIVWVGVIFHDPCLTGVRCPSTTTPENPMGFLKTTETTDQSESESESSQRSDASSDLRWLPSLRVDFFLVVFFRGMSRGGILVEKIENYSWYSKWYTPEVLTCPLKVNHGKKERLVFQPSCLRGSDCFTGGISGTNQD